MLKSMVLVLLIVDVLWGSWCPPQMDVLAFNDSYALTVQDCASDCHSAKSCDLVLHVGLCRSEKSTKWTSCDRTTTIPGCDNFHCSVHSLDQLDRVVSVCSRNVRLDTFGCGIVSLDGECVSVTSATQWNDAWTLQYDHFANLFSYPINDTLPFSFPMFYTQRINQKRPCNFSTVSPLMENYSSIIPQSFFRCFDPVSTGLRVALLYDPSTELLYFFETGQMESSSVLICTPTPDYLGRAGTRLTLMIVGISLSMVCLVLTVFAVVLVGEHTSVPSLNLLCLTASLAVAYASVLVQFTDRCTVLGFVHVYALLATVLWMNVIAFDIWRTLSSVCHLPKYLWRQYLGRVAAYSAYAWGAPAVLMGVGAALDLAPGVPLALKPGFVGKCWFTEPSSTTTLLLYHCPIGLITLVNAVFFALTARVIHSAANQLQSTRTKTNRLQFALYVKLFLVMGLTWLLEALTEVFDFANFTLVNDIINSLQGFFIFLIFGCKKRVLKRLCRGRQTLAAASTQQNGTPVTRTSL